MTCFLQTPQALKHYYEKNANLAPRIPHGTSRELTNLLNGLLKRNADQRLDFEAFFNHIFIRPAPQPPAEPSPPPPSTTQPIPAPRSPAAPKELVPGGAVPPSPPRGGAAPPVVTRFQGSPPKRMDSEESTTPVKLQVKRHGF